MQLLTDLGGDCDFYCLISKTLLALLQNVVAHTLTTRDGDDWVLVLLGESEDVTNAGSEGAALAVLHMHDLEGTDVLLSPSDGTDTALILTPGHDTGGTNLELNNIGSLTSGEVHLHDIVVLGERVSIANGAAIVGADVWDTLGTNRDTLDLAELELVLSVVSLAVGANLPIDLDEALHQDLRH